MTLSLRISNLVSLLRKAEAARAGAPARAMKPSAADRPSTAAEEFGACVAADAWQYACNQRAFR